MTEVVVVRRRIAATPERLFAAWTTPASLLAWFGPKGVRCTAAEVDLRVGGSYRLGNELPDGRVLWIWGEFEVIVPPRELVYSWCMDDAPPSRVTVRFEPIATGCEVIVIHDRVHAREARDDREHGWIGCLDKLAAWLGGRRA